MNVQSKFGMAALLVLAAGIALPNEVVEEYVPEFGQFKFKGDSVALALTSNAGHPKVIVDLGDENEYSFVVDTGASVHVIDTAIAERLGYEVIGETEVGAPGGAQIAAEVVRIPLVKIGDAEIRDGEFVAIDIDSFSFGLMQGVIGVGLFADDLLTFDQQQSELRVSREELTLADRDVMRYDDVAGHIYLDLDVAGTAVTSVIDTGSMGRFVLPIELKDTLSLQVTSTRSASARLVGGDRKIEIAKLDGDILFAGVTYENPDIGFIDPSLGVGNIGSFVIGDFAMSIDQSNKLIRFVKSSADNTVAANSSKRQIGAQFRGMPGGSRLTIAGVMVDSLAERSGLMPGDVLMRINDKPSEAYDMGALVTLFGGSELLQLDVERDGELIRIEIE